MEETEIKKESGKDVWAESIVSRRKAANSTANNQSKKTVTMLMNVKRTKRPRGPHTKKARIS